MVENMSLQPITEGDISAEYTTEHDIISRITSNEYSASISYHTYNRFNE